MHAHMTASNMRWCIRDAMMVPYGFCASRQHCLGLAWKIWSSKTLFLLRWTVAAAKLGRKHAVQQGSIEVIEENAWIEIIGSMKLTMLACFDVVETRAVTKASKTNVPCCPNSRRQFISRQCHLSTSALYHHIISLSQCPSIASD